MNKLYFLIITLVCALNTSAQHVSGDSILGRPFKEFSTTAFCKYSSFHPSQYITDNNWDILCAYRTPGAVARLDSLRNKA